jgi:hypothetical protein
MDQPLLTAARIELTMKIGSFFSTFSRSQLRVRPAMLLLQNQFDLSSDSISSFTPSFERSNAAN